MCTSNHSLEWQQELLPQYSYGRGCPTQPCAYTFHPVSPPSPLVYRLNPRIDNLDRVLRRIRGDLAFLTRCIEAGQEQVAAADAQQAAAAAATAAAGEQQQRQQQLAGVTGLDPAASASATAVAMNAAAMDTAQTADAAVGSGVAVMRGTDGALTPGARQAPAPANCILDDSRGAVRPARPVAGPAEPRAGGPPGPGAGVQRSGVVLDATRIQGIVNNLRGFQVPSFVWC